MARFRTMLVLALAAVSLGGLSACGGHDAAERTEGETEGIFVNAGGLLYQVQLSRILNPFVIDDQAYFNGLPVPGDEPDRGLRPDEVWFGVFIRVQNEGHEPIRSAREFRITDTQENVYVPVELPEQNAFAYRPEVVQEDEALPRFNSAAAERPPNGSLLLFKLKRFSFENRPLEFHIEAPGAEPQEAEVVLDV